MWRSIGMAVSPTLSLKCISSLRTSRNALMRSLNALPSGAKQPCRSRVRRPSRRSGGNESRPAATSALRLVQQVPPERRNSREKSQRQQLEPRCGLEFTQRIKALMSHLVDLPDRGEMSPWP